MFRVLPFATAVGPAQSGVSNHFGELAEPPLFFLSWLLVLHVTQCGRPGSSSYIMADSIDKAERAVAFQAYLAQHQIRDKLEAALTELIVMDELPANPFASLVANLSQHELMCRAKIIFNAMDTDGSGMVDRAELYKKLQADDEVETLLKRKAITGDGMPAAKAMGRLLVGLDTDVGQDMGSGVANVSWNEFERAVKAANA